MKPIFLILLFSGVMLTNVFAQSNKKVLMIGIDGCRSDALIAANTPNLDQLVSNGIYSPDALNDDITISGPGWSAVLCGVWSDKHNVVNNDFSSNNYEEYPSIFRYIDQYNPELQSVSICHWNPINDEIIGDDADFKLNVDSDLEVSQQAAAYLSINDPDLIFLHFDDIDHAGHGSGFSPTNAAYITAIESVDTHIGTVVQAIQARPDYQEEDWLILVTTDHGGLGTSHGGNSIQEQNVFVIASGNNVATEIILKDSMTVFNGANDCLDYSQYLQFDGNNDYVQIPPLPAYNFGSDQDFTVECRIRTSQAADVAIVGNKDWDSGLNPGFVFSFSYPSGPEWKVNIGDGSNRVDINTGGSIADNEWHTLSASFDRDGLLRIYEDGNILDSADISNIGNINANQGLFLGSDFLNDYNYAGQIAEVRIWNTKLSTEEIGSWSCQALNEEHTNWSNLLGYWPIQDAFDNQVTDFSSNMNHGTIEGANWTTNDSITVFDYSQTPRLVDIPITALTHLCVPIETSWDLEGSSLIPDCIVNNNERVLSPAWNIYPNPSNDGQLYFSSPLTEKYHLRVSNAKGVTMQEVKLKAGDEKIQLHNIKAGTYFLHFNSEENTTKTVRIIIH